MFEEFDTYGNVKMNEIDLDMGKNFENYFTYNN